MIFYIITVYTYYVSEMYHLLDLTVKGHAWRSFLCFGMCRRHVIWIRSANLIVFFHVFSIFFHLSPTSAWQWFEQSSRCGLCPTLSCIQCSTSVERRSRASTRLRCCTHLQSIAECLSPQLLDPKWLCTQVSLKQTLMIFDGFFRKLNKVDPENEEGATFTKPLEGGSSWNILMILATAQSQPGSRWHCSSSWNLRQLRPVAVKLVYKIKKWQILRCLHQNQLSMA